MGRKHPGAWGGLTSPPILRGESLHHHHHPASSPPIAVTPRPPAPVGSPSLLQQWRRGQGTSQAWPVAIVTKTKRPPDPPGRSPGRTHVNPLGQKQNRLANGVWL